MADVFEGLLEDEAWLGGLSEGKGVAVDVIRCLLWTIRGLRRGGTHFNRRKWSTFRPALTATRFFDAIPASTTGISSLDLASGASRAAEERIERDIVTRGM